MSELLFVIRVNYFKQFPEVEHVFGKIGRADTATDPAPLVPTLERYTPYLERYDLENAVCPGTFTLEDMPWNWKVMFENFNDGYHANRLHQFVQDFCPSSLVPKPARRRRAG